MTSTHQQRAGRASQQLRGVPEGRVRERYNTLAHKLPVLIRTNGLLQTSAFLLAKSKVKEGADARDGQAERLLLDHLRLHLVEAQLLAPNAGPEGFVEMLTGLASAPYRRMQDEALACLVWQKRFCAAKFGPPGADSP